ncbi:hypothetical protein [Micrococcus sp. TA1]|uniref:hypothetical protein n=1 Tax=Micrococcus sp. TA1 TaxID=681627 RepID=UPI0016169A81|nr:hypothetical protein [Micrococcus sp. TA1]MBB5748518.1 hypothetical protein [Micrococcus sp. TA1]
MSTTEYQTITEWEKYEGAILGYNTHGDEVIEVEKAQSEAECLKWGETYRPGRRWHATREDGTIIHGQATNLREAKKAALEALK